MFADQLNLRVDIGVVPPENSTSAGNWAQTCHSLFLWNNFKNISAFFSTWTAQLYHHLPSGGLLL